MKLEEIASALEPYLPPAFGAFIGLRWASEQTPVQKLTGFGCGFGLSVFIAPAIAEALSLGPKLTVAVGVIVAVVGMDVLGGLMAAARAFQLDPLKSFREWWGAWWQRGGQ